MKTDRRYSTTARRDYIESRLGTYDTEAYSLRDIAWDVHKHFEMKKPPAAATISNDLLNIREKLEAEAKEAGGRTLDPSDFPTWRAEHFYLPSGEGYLTPKHQHALFWVIVCLAKKWSIPDWVIEYLDLPEDINDMVLLRNVLLTFVLLVAPRHGKTELVLHTLIWLIIFDPNIRIIYAQGVARTAGRMMDYVKFELEFNERLVEKYGPFRGDTYAWNKEEFTVATRTAALKSPTFLPIGITTNIRSVDADIIIVDDPQDVRRVVSETVAESDYHHVTTELMTRREAHTPVFGIGSHLPVPWGDLWSMLEENAEALSNEGQQIIIRKIRAHKDEICKGEPHLDCVLWPEVRPWWFLMAQKAILDSVYPGLFDVVYNQLPKAAQVSYFDIEVLTSPYVQPEKTDDTGKFESPIAPEDGVVGVLDFNRSWKTVPRCCGKVILTMGFDPAAGTSTDSSESALVVRAGCSRCGRRFIVDYWRKRQSPERHPDTIESFVRSYRPEGLGRGRIEVNAYQKALSRDPRVKEIGRKYRFHIEEWNTDDRKWDPSLGIPNLARQMNDGYTSVPFATKADRDYAKGYIDAYRRYPRKPNDVPMADWLAELELFEAIRAETFDVPEEGPGHEDMPPYLQEEVWEFEMNEVEGNEMLILDVGL
jgi:hypothetical protein